MTGLNHIDTAFRKWWLGGHSTYTYAYPLFRRTAAPPLKVRVLGDHSDYHCGSWAAINSIRRNCLRSGYLLAGRYEPFDILVVNGEGSMHGSRTAPRNVFTKKMKVLKRAVARGVPAYLVNTVWQDNVPDYDDVLRRLHGIQVREAESQRALLEEHGVVSSVKIDAAFFLDIEFAGGGPRSGPVLITDFFMADEGRFRWQDLGMAGAEYVSMSDLSWPQLVTRLAASPLLVTGRHHAIFAACKARTPFVVLKGNNHKVTGLLRSAGVDIPVAQDISEIPGLIAELPRHADAFRRLFDWMHDQADSPILPPARRKDAADAA